MAEKMPVGVQIARIVNLVAMIVSIVVGVLLVAIVIPNFIKGAHHAGGQPNLVFIIIIGLIVFIVGAIPAILLLVLNRNLKKMKASARTWQIMVSCLLLLCFPMGTVLSMVVLYFMLIDKRTKEVFIKQ